MNKISVIIPAYQEGKEIKETLESVKDIADEIIIVLDGENTKTLKFAEKYTNEIYIIPHKGRSAFATYLGLKKAKYNWILKLDADESLSKELQEDIRNLIKENVDGFSFIHPLWDGEKTITKNYPRKTILVRKSKVSYLGFPGHDASIRTLGKIKKTNYVIIHKPKQNQDVGWIGFKEKVLKRYAPNQAKYILKEFEDFPTFQYDKDDLPFKIKIRKFLPIFTNAVYAFLVSFKMLFEGALENSATFKVVLKTFVYNIYLGYLIHKEKRKITLSKLSH